MICVCVFMYEWVQVVSVRDGVDVSGCMGLWFALCSPLESKSWASRSASGNKGILLEHGAVGFALSVWVMCRPTC